MRLSAIITVVIFIIVLTIFSVVNHIWLEWIDKEPMKWILFIGYSVYILNFKRYIYSYL